MRIKEAFKKAVKLAKTKKGSVAIAASLFLALFFAFFLMIPMGAGRSAYEGGTAARIFAALLTSGFALGLAMLPLTLTKIWMPSRKSWRMLWQTLLALPTLALAAFAGLGLLVGAVILIDEVFLAPPNEWRSRDVLFWAGKDGEPSQKGYYADVYAPEGYFRREMIFGCESEERTLNMSLETEATETLPQGGHEFDIRIDEGDWERHAFQKEGNKWLYDVKLAEPVKTSLLQKMTQGNRIEIMIPHPEKDQVLETFPLTGFNQAIYDLRYACTMPPGWDENLKGGKYYRCGTACSLDLPMWMRPSKEREKQKWTDERTAWVIKRREAEKKRIETLGWWVHAQRSDPMTDEVKDTLYMLAGEERHFAGASLNCDPKYLHRFLLPREYANQERPTINFHLHTTWPWAPWDSRPRDLIFTRGMLRIDQHKAVGFKAVAWPSGNKEAVGFHNVAITKLEVPMHGFLQAMRNGETLRVRVSPPHLYAVYREFSLEFLGDALKTFMERCPTS